jgi:hypothetical protein
LTADERRAQLRSYFENVDEDKRSLAFDAIDEYIFFSNRIAELRALPFIRVHPKDKARQQLTPAAKLVREYSQAVDAKRKTLLMILYRVENSAADELLQRLAEFE